MDNFETIIESATSSTVKVDEVNCPLICKIKQCLMENTDNIVISLRDILYNAELITSNVVGVVRELYNIKLPEYVQ